MNDDLISRDAVLDACSQSINILDAMSRIEDLPSVTPKQEPCEDAISRQAVWDVMQELWGTSGELLDRLMTLPSVTPMQSENTMMAAAIDEWRGEMDNAIKRALEKQRWIPVSERLPELNKPLLVTAYHRVCYAHMISESGNYGYPVFRLHEIKDSDRGWVQETISHEPYSKGRIDAWMYIDIPEPYMESEG